MKKAEFIRILTNSLKERNISDVDEIVAEYKIFFDQKLADGHTEEEIAARLGDPKDISLQFDIESAQPAPGNKTIVRIGLAFADFFIFLFFILLYAWVLVMVAGAIASSVLGVFLLFDLNISNLIPSMPDFIRVLFGVVSIELSVLFGIGAVYFWLFVRQLLRSYFRFHRNTIASASGEGILPRIPINPQIPAVKNRRMRNITLIVLTVFVISTLSGFIAASLTAGSLGFWHVWGWFGYP